MKEHITEFVPKLTHYSKRVKPISAIVVHYNSLLGTPSKDPYNTKGVIELLDNYKLSYHYLIGRDGSLELLVPPEHKSWHAGVSVLHGQENVNDFSIGICLVGSGLVPFSPEAMNTFIALVRILRGKYSIPLNNIVGHNQVSPGRKSDPGPYWDWRVLDKIPKSGV